MLELLLIKINNNQNNPTIAKSSYKKKTQSTIALDIDNKLKNKINQLNKKRDKKQKIASFVENMNNYFKQ